MQRRVLVENIIGLGFLMEIKEMEKMEKYLILKKQLTLFEKTLFKMS